VYVQYDDVRGQCTTIDAAQSIGALLQVSDAFLTWHTHMIDAV